MAFNGFGEAQAIDGLLGTTRERYGVEARHYPADLSRPAEVSALVRGVQDDLGSVDILVNNAGIQHLANVEDLADDRWDAILAINLSSN